VTRVPGSFDKLLEAFAHLKEIGLRVNLKTPATRSNQEELKGIRAIGDRFGFRVQFDLAITPRDDGDESPLQHGVSPEFLERYYSEEFAAVRKEKSGKLPQFGDNEVNCGTGRTGFMVDPYGNMFPCVQWRTRKFANILEIDSIGDVWHSSPILHDVRRIARDVTMTTLKEVEYGKVCGFCPALAELQTGDASKVYDQARLKGEAIQRAHRKWKGGKQASVR
jgi:radical SAM protein with 4Fe4S-binding SPASM domain